MDNRRFVFVSVVAGGLVLAGVFPGLSFAGQAGSGSPTASITFSGKVLQKQGQPIEGARVQWYQMTYTSAGVGPKMESLGEKTTATDGTFTLSAAKDAPTYRQSFLIVRKEGLALGWVAWPMREDQQASIALGEPKPLAGTVVDENGRTLAEVEVSIALALIGAERDQRFLVGWAAPDLLKAKTDSQGRFLFADMPAEATFEFLAAQPGRATICTLDRATYRGEKCQFSPGQEGIKLTLPVEAKIEGLVVEKAGGKPRGGVRVTMQSERSGPLLPMEPVASGTDGVFRVGSLAAGNYTVQLVSLPGQMAEWVADPVRVSLKTGETKSDIKLALVKGGILEVLVKDTAGKPVSQASVSLRQVQSEQWVGVTTDETGLARQRLAPGEYAFSGAYKQGYSQPRSQEQLVIEEGQTKRLEYTLNSMPKVAGIVRDQAGQPLAGIKVEVKPTGRDEAVTDAAGKFEANWDPAAWGSRSTTFVLVARDLTRNLAEAVDLDEQPGQLDLKLRPGMTITGTVLDAEGKPLPGARIRLMLRVANWGSTLTRGESPVGPDGTFEIKALPPERKYQVTALADGYGKQDVQVNDSDFKDNRYDVGRLKLPVASLSITGTVVDPNDKPVAGASIYGYGDGQPDLRDIQTDTEGKFTIKGVCPGALRLSVNSRGPSRLYGSAQTEGGAADLRIVISSRPTSPAYMPPRPASLKGKPLPPLKDLGIDPPAEAEGKMLLVCFWDMGQRPSRYCLTQLAAQASQLGDKGVVVVAVQAAQVEENALSGWLQQNKVPFKTGTLTGNADKAKFAWGAAALPHLILTDRKHTVVAEGFSLSDLDKQIEAAAAR